MTKNTIDLIINEALALTDEDESKLERALYKIDRIDRRTVVRDSFFDLLLGTKYIFEPAKADKTYRAFRELVFKTMVYQFFDDENLTKVVDSIESSEKGKGYAFGFRLGFLCGTWKRENFNRIVKEVSKQVKSG